MTDDRGTCRHCRREGLRMTEKGLIWPHRSKNGSVCPAAPPLDDTTNEPAPKKRKERK